MSLLDRALRFAEEIAPEWGLRRARARLARQVLAQGYGSHGASTEKKSLKAWRTSAGGPDTDIIDHLEKLRERSRDLFMGEGLAAGALKTIRTNEIGPGLRLNCAVDADLLGLSPDEAQAWESTVEREFALWANSKACDAARRSTFGELQGLARLSWLLSGDVFALLPMIDRPGDRYGLKVSLLEADRVCDPSFPPRDADILGGVEVDDFGAPVAYWIKKTHPGDEGAFPRLVTAFDKHDRIPAFDDEGRPLVLHLMESERPGQRRGVPVLAPVIEKLKQLTRYTDAELMAAVVTSMFTVAITSDAPQNFLQGAIPTDEKVDEDDPASYEMGNGTFVSLAPGEKVEPLDPSRPNAGFQPFVEAVSKQIGAGLGIPYELLIMQFTASYSASRGALLEAWKRFSVGRAWMAAGFCQPIYEQWLEEAVAQGFVDAPGFFSDPLTRAAWCGAEWHGPTQGQLDPVKEVEAARIRVEQGFSSRTAETRALTGLDFWDVHRLRAREEQARIADGLAVDPTAVVEPPPAEEAVA